MTLTFDAHQRSMLTALGEAFARHSKTLYLVGGTVRDAVMGKPVTGDFDFATSALTHETNFILRELVGDTLVSGVWSQGEKFGTVAASWSDQHNVFCPSYSIEITTYRSEAYDPSSRKPCVQWGATLVDDVARRDFTVNALALDPLTLEIIDFHEGLADIKNGVIRAVGRPSERFSEDPLRMLRAIRFATRFGWRIDKPTWYALKTERARLAIVSHERIRDELDKILAIDECVTGLDFLIMSNLLVHVMPDLQAIIKRSMTYAVQRATDLPCRWACLLFDSPDQIKDLLTDLRKPHDEQRLIESLVRGAKDIGLWDESWRHGDVRRLMRRIGKDRLPLALQVADAIWPSYADKHKRLQKLTRKLDSAYAMDSPLSGDQLQAMFPELPPGPWIGRVKEWLLQDVLFDKLRQDDTEEAESLARIYVDAIQEKAS